MPKQYTEEEELIKQAHAAWEGKFYSTKAEAARDFDREKTNQVLDSAQLKVLHTWLEQVDKAGTSATPEMLRSTANSILKRNHTEEGPPREAQAIEPDRIHAWNLGMIETYFDRLRIAQDRYGIQKADFYNMDENIITLNSEGKHYIPASSSRKSLTAVECISADGWVMKPLLILPGVVHLEDWYADTDLPGDYLIATSPTGFTTDEIALGWIKHFNLQTKKRQQGEYRMILMDSHGSHLTYELLDYCNKNKILVYFFPPHTTHILQPLNGLPFRQLKHFHGKMVNGLERFGCRVFDTRGFLKEIDSVRNDAFKPSTIQSSFKKVGLFPWDPRIILDDLEKKVAAVPDLHGLSDVDGEGAGKTPPPPDPVTPTTIRSFRRNLGEITPLLNEVSPTLRSKIIRTMKGGLYQAELGAHNATQVAGMLAAQARHNTTKSRKSLQVGGLMYVKDAVRKISSKQEKIEAAARKKMERKVAAAKKAAEKRERQEERQQPKKSKKIKKMEAADNAEITDGLLELARGFVE